MSQPTDAPGARSGARPGATLAVDAGVILTSARAALASGAVIIEGFSISEIGGRALLQTAMPREILGGDHTIALPGLVNAHHHTGLTPLQHGVPFRPLETWLPLFMGFRSVDPYLDTLYSALQMLRGGITTVQHIHGGLLGPRASWRSQTERVLEAYRASGMRVSYCFMVRDQRRFTMDEDDSFIASLPPALRAEVAPLLEARSGRVEDYIEFFEELADEYNHPGSLIRVQLAPANLHWCSDHCLKLIHSAAERADVGLHMHLLETRSQKEFAERVHGRSAVEHLDFLGLLSPRMTLGHGNWVSDRDLDRIASSGTLVCHNPSSGLRLRSGIAPVGAMLGRNIKVALGIDQSGINDDHDILQEMRLAWCLHQCSGPHAPNAAAILAMATEDGAATTPFAQEIGTLAPGKAADIVLLDRRVLSEPYLDADTPLVDAILHRAKQNAVTTVVVGGEVVVKGGMTTKVDEADVLREIGKVLGAPLSVAEQHARHLVRALQPYTQAVAARWQPPFPSDVFHAFNSRGRQS